MNPSCLAYNELMPLTYDGLVFKNTNPIIGQRHEFIVSKTGWIRAAGGCIVMMVDTDVGRRIVVVLGSKNTRTRIPEAEFISKIN
jgi:D-alanyl-D-alanine carboxypeptidase